MAESSAARFVRLEMEGLASLQQSMKKAGAQAAELAGANQAVVDLIASSAKREVPVRSGKLKQSIHGTATQRVGTLIAGASSVPYAGPIHFGWATRGLGRGKTKKELIGQIGSLSAFSRRKGTKRYGGAGIFTDKALRLAANRENRGAGAKKKSVRGGPIRPNPFLYRALDHRFDDVVAEYDKHIDGIAAAVNSGAL